MNSSTALVVGSQGPQRPRPVASAASPFQALPDLPYDRTILYDSLPYFDPPVDAKLQAEVSDRIHEESLRSTKSPQILLEEKLRSLGIPLEIPPISTILASRGAPLMAAALKEIEENSGLPNASAAATSPDAPQHARALLKSRLQAQISHTFTSSPSEVAVQLGYFAAERTALEELKENGSEQWQAQQRQLEEINKRLTAAVGARRVDVENVHRKRKSDQLFIGAQLKVLEGKFHSAVSKTVEINRKCWAMENSIKNWKKLARERGMAEEKIIEIFGAEEKERKEEKEKEENQSAAPMEVGQ